MLLLKLRRHHKNNENSFESWFSFVPSAQIDRTEKAEKSKSHDISLLN